MRVTALESSLCCTTFDERHVKCEKMKLYSNHPKSSEQKIVTHVSSRNFQKVHLAKRARQRSEPSRIRLCLSGAELAHSEMASMQ